MSMGIVSDEEFNQQADKYKATVVPIQLGRGHNPQTPEALRKLVAENALEEGNKETKNLTRALGLSDSSLSAYKNGSTSCATYHQPSPELKSHVNRARERIVKKARNRLVQSLDAITTDKLAEVKARDLAGIAKDMSAVIRNMEPEKESEKTKEGNKALIIFAPQFVSEEKFDLIEVQE